MPFRALLFASAILTATCLASYAFAQGSLKENTTYLGGDFKDFDVKGGATDCQQACVRDPHCAQWSFVKPASLRMQGHCFLKNKPTKESSDRCCTSGTVRMKMD